MKDTAWDRAICLIDMNAFFASIEQLDHPQWRGRPVAVTNGSIGTCIITCSYEARAFGIKTGMRLKAAYALCPHLIRAPSRPQRYAAISAQIMQSLQTITPDIEIFSIDEAFLDLTHCQKLYKSPLVAAKLAKRKIFEVSRLLCSVGLSGDKTTAKWAAKLQKPNGFTVVYPWEAKQRLQNIPVNELCGVAKGITRFLAQYGATTCGDVANLPISVLAKRYGNLGRRLWYMCQGADPEPVHNTIPQPKSMGHGKVLPPKTRDKEIILTYLQHMTEKLAARLRHGSLEAQTFFIGMCDQTWGWLGGKYKLAIPNNDGRAIYKLCHLMLDQHADYDAIYQVQVTALDPRAEQQQLDLFTEQDHERQRINHMIDHINTKFGALTITSARLIQRSSIPNVIAPAWRPDSHRDTI